MTYYARNLPHWHPQGKDIFITWRLHGSLPARVKILSSHQTAGKRFLSYDSALDKAAVGPTWLNDARIAESVIETFHNCQANELFRLHSYVVMTNHVHVLLEPRTPIAQITQVIKGATARDANRILGLTGNRFWQDESFDHWIRTSNEWRRIQMYIENNPVAAGLVVKPEDWPWSSASRPIP